MIDVYPAPPAAVPADLTRPSPAYKRHAYLAVAGLFGFVALYFALAGWFAYTAYRLLANLGHDDQVNPAELIGGVGAAFLAVFMLKAIVFVRRGTVDNTYEITAATQPRLFGFLHRVADEAGAPRPHRVFLSPRVNAGVFYDLSIANLFFTSRKNLEIGLGLVNVLPLGELKAVLAHEFGHFGQRTMAVGRWVYIAQQIAGHIVARRDFLDRVLQWISSVDLRVAWIGWIMRLIVWSIRSLVDTLFGWVVLAQRALSREMELQADLVAVSLTGSDALIHALHRLDAADDAMDRAFGFAAAEQSNGRAVADIFAVQTRMLDKKRFILDDPTYGHVPPLPTAPAGHRLFQARVASPPRMWSTHPSNEVREENAKRVYVPAALDERSSWLLFDDPAAVKAAVSALLHADDDKKPAIAPIEATLSRLEERFDRRYFDPSYRGAYLGRSVVRHARSAAELYAERGASDLATALEAIYPSSLSRDLERVRELEEEKAILVALQRGVLQAAGGVVRHRGQEHRRRDLPALLEDVERDLAAARRVVHEHDRLVRSVHLEAARSLSPAWEAYLRGLAGLLHYAEHREADIDDAIGSFANVFAIVTADRKVTAGEIERLTSEALAVYGVIVDIFRQAPEVDLGPVLAARLEIASWTEALGAFELPAPTTDNIGQWLEVWHSWASAASNALSGLGGAALDELIRAEEEVALHVKAGTTPPAPPAPPRPPARYGILLPGHERPRQTRLGWWDRFQVADGLVPSLLRFAVAAAIVGGVLYAGA
jgi:Zn-dependent protease with chaperone function